MTHEEKMAVCKILGKVDHLISGAEIDIKVYRPAEKDKDAFTRGLGRGKVDSAEYALRHLAELRSELEQLIEWEANHA